MKREDCKYTCIDYKEKQKNRAWCDMCRWLRKRIKRGVK